MALTEEKPWVVFNICTQTYDTRDGTKVAAELVESIQCLADVLNISLIRERQREAINGSGHD